MARPKGSKNVRRKERKERRLAQMRKMPTSALISPLEPEEGLVCMGDRCWILKTYKGKAKNKAAPPGMCPKAREGNGCDAMF